MFNSRSSERFRFILQIVRKPLAYKNGMDDFGKNSHWAQIVYFCTNLAVDLSDSSSLHLPKEFIWDIAGFQGGTSKCNKYWQLLGKNFQVVLFYSNWVLILWQFWFLICSLRILEMLENVGFPQIFKTCVGYILWKKPQEEQIVYFHQNLRLNFRTCENDDRIKLWLNDKAQKFVNYLSILFCF